MLSLYDLVVAETINPNSLTYSLTHASRRLKQKPGRVAQSVGHLTHKSEVLGSIPGLTTSFVSPSADSRVTVFSYWRKYMHEVLVNRLGGLSLPRKCVVRLTDRPDMTLDVYRGRKTTIQQQQQLKKKLDQSIVISRRNKDFRNTCR